MPTTTTPTTEPSVEPAATWLRYRRELLAGIAVMLLAAIAYGGYLFYQQRRETNAAEALAAAKTAGDFQNVISQYSGTPAAASAYLLLAEQQRSDGKFSDANATLQKFVIEFPKNELVSTARMSMAANLESLGKADDALSTYQKLVAADPHSFNAPLALISEVPLLKAKGQTEEARKVCERIVSEYRDSYVIGEATRQMRLLQPKIVDAPSPAPSVAPNASAPAAAASTAPTTPPPAKP